MTEACAINRQISRDKKANVLAQKKIHKELPRVSEKQWNVYYKVAVMTNRQVDCIKRAQKVKKLKYNSFSLSFPFCLLLSDEKNMKIKIKLFFSFVYIFRSRIVYSFFVSHMAVNCRLIISLCRHTLTQLPLSRLALLCRWIYATMDVTHCSWKKSRERKKILSMENPVWLFYNWLWLWTWTCDIQFCSPHNCFNVYIVFCVWCHRKKIFTAFVNFFK